MESHGCKIGEVGEAAALPSSTAPAHPNVAFYESRAEWYRDGCEGLEGGPSSYRASGDLERDAASDILALCSRIRDFEHATAQAESDKNWLRAQRDVAEEKLKAALLPVPSTEQRVDASWLKVARENLDRMLAHVDDTRQIGMWPTWSSITGAELKHFIRAERYEADKSIAHAAKEEAVPQKTPPIRVMYPNDLNAREHAIVYAHVWQLRHPQNCSGYQAVVGLLGLLPFEEVIAALKKAPQATALRADMEAWDAQLAHAAPSSTGTDLRADAAEIRSSYGFVMMRLAVCKDAQDAFDVCKREFQAHEAAFRRLGIALGQEPAETLAICERCQMRVPERLATFGIGVRGGHAAWCAVCKPIEGPEGEAKRAEVVAMRRAALAPSAAESEHKP